MKVIPNYHPPSDYRRPTKTQEKVYVPVNDYPEINFSMIANLLTTFLVFMRCAVIDWLAVDRSACTNMFISISISTSKSTPSVHRRTGGWVTAEQAGRTTG